AKVAMEFLAASHQYRRDVADEHADPNHLACAFYAQYLHSYDGAPVIQASRGALSRARTGLTSLAATACGASVPSDHTTTSGGVQPQLLGNLPLYRASMVSQAADVFQDVEREVIAQLERQTLCEFYGSRYYVLVDLLCGIHQVTSRRFRFKEFMSAYMPCFTPTRGFQHPLDKVKSDSMTEDATQAVRKQNGLPIASILSTLDSLVHTDGPRLSPSERDAIVVAHYMVSSYAQLDLEPVRPRSPAAGDIGGTPFPLEADGQSGGSLGSLPGLGSNMGMGSPQKASEGD
ncbi:hypothetical protein KIPB_011402, partial [Kipferlia bialata]